VVFFCSPDVGNRGHKRSGRLRVRTTEEPLSGVGDALGFHNSYRVVLPPAPGRVSPDHMEQGASVVDASLLLSFPPPVAAQRVSHKT